ncbi:hypothetical protein PGIGA_G00190910, partial [Pangasianodon gigas]|nr:hypothetical protein [Pangasianodon gigas]
HTHTHTGVESCKHLLDLWAEDETLQSGLAHGNELQWNPIREYAQSVSAPTISGKGHHRSTTDHIIRAMDLSAHQGH